MSVLGANCDCLSVGHLIEPLPKIEDDPDGNRFTPHLHDVGMRLLYLPAGGSSSKIDIVRDRIGDYKPGWLQVRWLVAWALLASVGYAAFIGLALCRATDGFHPRWAGAIYAASIVAGILLPAMFIRLG